MTIRKALFWVHLAAGLAAGLVIAIMCVTGAALAFEDQLVAWAERDARLIPHPAAGAARLTPEAMQDAFARAVPGKRPESITFNVDPRAAVIFDVGRREIYYLNPYDGTVRQPASHAMRELMDRLTDWHRALGRPRESRETARMVTGACNAAFLFLAVSGVVLWWPRKWRTKGLKRSLWFLRGVSGRARDWNWHNVTGFWLLPALITLSASGVVLSYRGVNDWVFRLAGDSPSAPRGSRPEQRTPPLVAPPAPDAPPLDVTSLLATAQRQFPRWNTITLYLDQRGPATGDARRLPAFLGIRSGNAWPRTATTNLTLDPFTGAVRRIDDFRDQSPGRRARTWIRFLHTGEALGVGGQVVAGVACLGGVLLVCTGFALAWRRFRGEKKIAPESGPSGLG